MLREKEKQFANAVINNGSVMCSLAGPLTVCPDLSIGCTGDPIHDVWLTESRQVLSLSLGLVGELAEGGSVAVGISDRLQLKGDR